MNNSKPLTNLIHEQIYRDVIDGTFSPNDMLTESALIQRYGVSKSPVREALISLCDERVLQSIPRKGYRIVQFTLEEVRQITETRQALELFMFDKAYPSMGERELNLLLECNTGFHLLLASFPENDYMLSLLKSTLRINARAATRYYESIYSPELEEKKRTHELLFLQWIQRVYLSARSIQMDDTIQFFWWEVRHRCTSAKECWLLASVSR